MPGPLMTISEAAEYLGVSVATGYRMEAAGQLPTIQLGGHGSKRVVRRDLEAQFGMVSTPEVAAESHSITR